MSTDIDERYSSFLNEYIDMYPPVGEPKEGTRALELKRAIELSYMMWLVSPNEYNEIINGLFSEFEAALGLLKLSGD